MGTIVGPHSGPKEALYVRAKQQGAKRQQEVFAFFDELYAQDVFDAFMIGVQSDLETDSWRSPYWENRLNPGAIGITGPPDGSVGWDQGLAYANGRDAARAMLIHHAAYTGITLPEAWKAWLHLDPRYRVVQEAGLAGSVKQWSDYGDGRWATDPLYYEKITGREGIIRQLVDAAGDGTMATPRIIDKWLHVAQDGYAAVNRRYIGRFGMQPKIIVLHIQEGINSGSWQHFHVVTASSTVLIGKNGDIWRLVPESDSPWTNGDVSNASPLAWEIMNQYGPDPNVYALTIETEGWTGEFPKTEALMNSVVWQIRTWMERYGIPLRYVIRHAEINSTSRRHCPGDAFYNEVIRRLQSTAPAEEPVYAKPVPVMVQGKPWDGSVTVNVNGALFTAERRTVHALSDGVNVRSRATTKSAETRKPLSENEEFTVLGWVRGEAVKGEDRWWITKAFSRINVLGTKEKPGDTKPQPVPTTPPPVVDQPDVPEGVRVLNGIVYYPVSKEEKSHEIVVTANAANLRAGNNTQSKAKGKTVKGDVHTVAYWCVGEEVNGEALWWVLDKEGDPLSDATYLWVAATDTNVRPD